MRLTLEDYHRLVEIGIIDKVELVEGRLMMGRFEIGLTDEQRTAARDAGIAVEPRTVTDNAGL